MARRLQRAALPVVLGLASIGCRVAPPPSASSNDVHENVRDRSIVCAGIEAACRRGCPESQPRDEHADCLLRLRFRDDPSALEIARVLYARSRTLLGSDHRGSIDGYGGAVIALEPALPIGADRHHLVWLASSLWSFDQFFAALAPHADVPIDFVTRPEAFLFFRTSTPEHPSEYFAEGCIGYNLDGPLNETHRAMHETLFHELFHLNDERRGGWSTAALEPLFDAIVARCGDEHGCYAPFAPSDTVVPGGTYYGFDARTRHVSEYAAEVALRYYLEHEAIVFGRKSLPPFKCGGEENFAAWDSIARAFFGGVDLVSDCAVVERANDDG